MWEENRRGEDAGGRGGGGMGAEKEDWVREEGGELGHESPETNTMNEVSSPVVTPGGDMPLWQHLR